MTGAHTTQRLQAQGIVWVTRAVIPVCALAMFACQGPPESSTYLYMEASNGDPPGYNCNASSTPCALSKGNPNSCCCNGSSTCPKTPENDNNCCFSDSSGIVTPQGRSEADEYYKAIGAVTPPGSSWNLLKLDDWKTRFGFLRRLPRETLQEFRDRTGIVVYYNENELGLGREMNCSQFLDGYDISGKPLVGVACWVTNYGQTFQRFAATTPDDGTSAIRDAVNGIRPKNTVCISYRPTLGAGNEVSFYVYSENGDLQNWAALDFMGARAVPQICTSCHGGTYDPKVRMARNAHFLPPNMYGLKFADDADSGLTRLPPGVKLPPGVTRVGQQERFRRINAMSMNADSYAQTTQRPDVVLTASQKEFITNTYSGAFGGWAQMGAVPVNPMVVPAGWSAQPDLYRKVIVPFCASCHFALQDQASNTNNFNDYDANWVQDWATLSASKRRAIRWDICGAVSPAGWSVVKKYYKTTASAILATNCTGCHLNGTTPPHWTGPSLPDWTVEDTVKKYAAQIKDRITRPPGTPGVMPPPPAAALTGDDLDTLLSYLAGVTKPSMPHSQPTMGKFWTDTSVTINIVPMAVGDPLPGDPAHTYNTFGGSYSTPKDALLAALGFISAECPVPNDLGCDAAAADAHAANSNCGTQNDPVLHVGSGRACASGVLGPLGLGPGRCKDYCDANPSGTPSRAQVGCPSHYECVTAQHTCTPCGRVGEKPCVNKLPKCEDGLTAKVTASGDRCVFDTSVTPCSDPTRQPDLVYTFQCQECVSNSDCPRGSGDLCRHESTTGGVPAGNAGSFTCAKPCTADGTAGGCTKFQACRHNVCIDPPTVDRYQDIEDQFTDNKQDRYYTIHPSSIDEDPYLSALGGIPISDGQATRIEASLVSGNYYFMQKPNDTVLEALNADGTSILSSADYATISGFGRLSPTSDQDIPRKSVAWHMNGKGDYLIRARNISGGIGNFQLMTGVVNFPKPPESDFRPREFWWAGAVGDVTPSGAVDEDWYQIQSDSALGIVRVQVDARGDNPDIWLDVYNDANGSPGTPFGSDHSSSIRKKVSGDTLGAGVPLWAKVWPRDGQTAFKGSYLLSLGDTSGDPSLVKCRRYDKAFTCCDEDCRLKTCHKCLIPGVPEPILNY